MSGYTFKQMPQLKQALLESNIQKALDIIPIVDAEDDEYKYLTLLAEMKSVFLSFYKTNNQIALDATIELITKSKNLYFTNDWPQFTDLTGIIVGAIAEMDNNQNTENILSALLTKLSLKDGYVANHDTLNYNLARYYAKKEDEKTMMEYILRASFRYPAEKFINDINFIKYKKEAFFLEPLKNLGHTACIWWTRLWPVEEWYEES
jgi:hypothetical protein